MHYISIFAQNVRPSKDLEVIEEHLLGVNTLNGPAVLGRKFINFFKTNDRHIQSLTEDEQLNYRCSKVQYEKQYGKREST